jgi:hypothetical protein
LLKQSNQLFDDYRGHGDIVSASVRRAVPYGVMVKLLSATGSSFGPMLLFRAHVQRYFKGESKPPFNREACAAAGFPARYYEPLLRGGVPLLRG